MSLLTLNKVGTDSEVDVPDLRPSPQDQSLCPRCWNDRIQTKPNRITEEHWGYKVWYQQKISEINAPGIALILAWGEERVSGTSAVEFGNSRDWWSTLWGSSPPAGLMGKTQAEFGEFNRHPWSWHVNLTEVSRFNHGVFFIKI